MSSIVAENFNIPLLVIFKSTDKNKDIEDATLLTHLIFVNVYRTLLPTVGRSAVFFQVPIEYV